MYPFTAHSYLFKHEFRRAQKLLDNWNATKERKEIRELIDQYHALCGHCAEKNPADAVYCRRCGEEIEKPEEENEEVEGIEEAD